MRASGCSFSATVSPPEIDLPGATAAIARASFCGIEVDRDTGVIRIDKYVSLHDAGRILNPALFDGQLRGSFAMAIGAALLKGGQATAAGAVRST